MTWVDVAVRAHGLSTRLAGDDLLAAVERARDPGALVAAVRAAGLPVERADEIDAAVASRAAAEIALLTRWAGDRAGTLAVIALDEDRFALRALVRGLAAGVPGDRRAAAAPGFEELARAATPAAFAAALARRGHPFAVALAAPLAKTPLDLFAIERALTRAFVARARRAGGDHALRVYTAQVVDAGNAAAALALAARGRDVTIADCFDPGGHLLSRAQFELAARDLGAARTILATVFRGTPLAAAPSSEAAALAWQLATQDRLRRTDPTGLAPVLAFVLHRRRESIELRRAAWRLALGGRR